MNKVIFIEGARNVGKTYLIGNLKSDIQTYKFPFAKYFKESFSKVHRDEAMEEVNSKKELYYLTLGYDITILDLFKKGLISENLIVDRGFLSNLVFGVQSGRITVEEGIAAWSWLCKEYEDCFEVVYVCAQPNNDGRNKDAWDIYGQKETMDLYTEFMDTSHSNVMTFENKFDARSVYRFNSVIDNIFYEHEEIPGR